MPSVIVWIITAIAVIFGAFVLIGTMAMRHPSELKFRGSGREDAEIKVPFVGTNLEMPTFTRFLIAASEGKFAGNVRTELPLFPEEGMKLFTKKYSEWAPEPWKHLPSPGPNFGDTSGQSPAPVIRCSFALSGMDIMMQDIFNLALAPAKGLDLSFKVLKSKIWFGLPPISAARWKAKGLDQEENIEEALAIIQQVVDVYEYMGRPEIQGDLRWTYNKIWAEIDVFQDAVAGLASSRTEPGPAWNLTKLWEAYFKAHTDHMDNQARSFIFNHLGKLREVWKARFVATYQSGRVLNERQATVKIDHWAMMVMNKISDTLRDADSYVRFRSEGFFFDGGIHGAFLADHGDKAKCQQIYTRLEGERQATLRSDFQAIVNERTAQRRAAIPEPPFMIEPGIMTDREFAHKGVQPEIENPPEMQIECWVQRAMDPKIESFGFVVYRLDYSMNDAEWQKFKKEFEARVDSGWKGVLGRTQVKDKATLHWVDGREEKIAADDVDAARKNFNTIPSFPAFPTGLQQDVFLAITSHTLSSFRNEAAKAPSLTDFGPFVLAVAATKPTRQDDAAPTKWMKHYKGEFNILLDLVFPDLYASHHVVSQCLEQYWALSLQHPWGVYVGTTTGVRRRIWRETQAGMFAGIAGASRAQLF